MKCNAGKLPWNSFKDALMVIWAPDQKQDTNVHFTIFVRHIRRFWPVFNKKSWPIMRPSALQRWLRWFISAMPTMHCTHVVQVKTCGWGWTTWLPSIWLRSDSSLMKHLFRRILATSYCIPSSRRWNIFRIKEHSQHCIDRSSAPIKVYFILERRKRHHKCNTSQAIFDIREGKRWIDTTRIDSHAKLLCS